MNLNKAALVFLKSKYSSERRFDLKYIFRNLIQLFLLLLTFQNSRAQDTLKLHAKRIGVIGLIDLEYNTGDELLSSFIERKWSVGICLANPNRKLITFLGGGFKGFKTNLYSPRFQESFLNDVKQNYFPVLGSKEDSIIGLAVSKYAQESPSNALDGNYAMHITVGVLLNQYKFKPSLILYAGSESFVLYTKYAWLIDKEKDWIAMNAWFYEVKTGFSILFKDNQAKYYAINVNLGYKWTNYGDIKFNHTTLDKYTNANLASKYQNTSQMTLSISYDFWSNWK